MRNRSRFNYGPAKRFREMMQIVAGLPYSARKYVEISPPC